jgi:PAS domain S-box-containing protein
MARILVVDDHVLNRTFLNSLLTHFGHDVSEAGDGVEALAALRKAPHDLLITDLLMPVMDGQELTRQIAGDPALGAMPIIFYTATYRAREAKAIAKSLGVRWVLPKPCEPQEILKTVYEALGRPLPSNARSDRREFPRLSEFHSVEKLNRDLAELLTHAIALTEKQRATVSELASLEDSLHDMQSLGLRMASLVEIGLDLSSQRKTGKLLELFCRAAQDMLSARYAGVAILEGGVVRHFAARGLPEGREAQVLDAVVRSKGAGSAMSEGRPIAWQCGGDASQDAELVAVHPACGTFLFVPVMAVNDRLGCLYVADRLGKEAFTDEDSRLALSVAMQLGVAWSNLTLYERAEAQAQALQREIAERERVARELRETELRFRQLAENIHEVFFLLDAEDGRMLYVSPAYEVVWGRSCASLYAAPASWAELIPQPERARVLEEFRNLQSTGRFEFEYSIVREDGSPREIRARGYPIRDEAGRLYRIAGIAEDITNKRRAERQLGESERRHAEMLRNVNLIAITLDRDAVLTFCNDYLLALTGWSREEVLGRSWFEIFVPAELANARAATFAGMLTAAPSSLHHESEILTRSGARRLIRWSNTVLRSAAGDIAGTASIGEDVTDYRAAMERIRELNAGLEERVAQRTRELEAANSELQAFTHAVSHDLRAPLNRIRGFSEMLFEESAEKLDEHEADLVRRIGSAGHDMDQLIRDLMELSTVTVKELRRGNVDLSALAKAVLVEMQSAEPDRKIELSIEPGMCARADTGLVRIVLQNLLGNAWKFTAKKGDGRQSAFFVRDNGAGFDAALVSKLFAPFQRLHAKSEFDGTGIGLATVQRIVHRHGGRVWAEGAVGKGANVHFTLGP